jgi:hypothetical protein
MGLYVNFWIKSPEIISHVGASITLAKHLSRELHFRDILVALSWFSKQPLQYSVARFDFLARQKSFNARLWESKRADPAPLAAS